MSRHWNKLWVLGMLIAFAVPAGLAEPIPENDDDRPARVGQRGRMKGRAGDGPRDGFKPGFGRKRFDREHEPLELTEEQSERVLEFMRQNFPERHQMLERLRERRPEMFAERLRKMAPRIMDMLGQLDAHPELGAVLIEQHKLQEELHDLMRSIRRRGETEPDSEQMSQIQEKVTRLVQLRLERRAFEIEGLARRLDEQRNRLDEDSERIDELVDEELEWMMKRRSFQRRSHRPVE
jgi:hypothetical protein